jgi:hypothetical protein
MKATSRALTVAVNARQSVSVLPAIVQIRRADAGEGDMEQYSRIRPGKNGCRCRFAALQTRRPSGRTASSAHFHL